MINTVFKATCDHPLKNDFVQTCQKYLKTINIHLSFEQIREMSKYRFKKYVKYSFKKYVKTQTKEAAFKHLIEQNKTKTGKHTKMVNLNYSELCIQEYLLEGNSSTEIFKLIFVRPYMKYRPGPRIQFAVCCLSAVQANFKSSYWSNTKNAVL